MESKPLTQVSAGGYCFFSDFSSNPTTIPEQLDQVPVHSFESSSSQVVINNKNSELFHLQSGMEMLGFPSSNNPQYSNKDSVTPKSSYSLNPFDNRNYPADFWKESAETQAKSDHHVSYQPQFDQNLTKRHDFSGGYSDHATHSSTNELSRESETPRFQIETPLQIETSQPNPTQSLIITQETAWQRNRLLANWANRFQGEENDEDESSCVFPYEANERRSQGLSLSLSSHTPGNIGLQLFELREAHSRDGFLGRSSNQFMEDERSFIVSSSSSFQHHQLKNSKYLAPAKELLNEFCNLGTMQTTYTTTKNKFSNQSSNRNAEGNNQSLYSTDLQKRKSMLVSMLEEVDRRYKHYCEQMREVVSSFESVAGNRAANVYSALASKAMSKHFRCLRDGIVGQIQATGEKEVVAPGKTRGETPRLKLLDQTLRQQKALQQTCMMENHPWRPERGLPQRSVSILRAWLFEHFLHPYPSDADKHILACQTGLSRSQVSNWFINARVRLWKPMVEDLYMEETKAMGDEVDHVNCQLNELTDQDPNLNSQKITSQNPNLDYQKSTLSQDFLHASKSLASIINLETKLLRNEKNQQQEQFMRPESFSIVESDLPSYNHIASTFTCSSNDDSNNHSMSFRNIGCGKVSLSLGLQQSGGGVSLSRAPHYTQLVLSGDHNNKCQLVEYTILDADETQGNGSFGSQCLPYRNLVGAHLLRDFAG